jgi:hypothetical protein
MDKLKNRILIKKSSKISILSTAFSALLAVLIFLIVQPIHSLKYNISIIFIIVCLVSLVIFFMRNYKNFLVSLLVFLSLPLLILANRAEINKEELKTIYLNQLATFNGVPYVWGGENCFGVDCSGLPRKSMINALVIYSIYNLNGTAASRACYYWWNDASALEMVSGYGGNTKIDSGIYTINSGIPNAVAGDMAITKGGVHVLVYLRADKIIQAEPGIGSVVIDSIPMSNSWYDEKVKLVKWSILQ